MHKYYLNALKGFFEITLVCTGVALVTYLTMGQILEISGDSMYPTVKDKEHILAETISPKFSKFQKDEIIVFKHPDEEDKLIIKRIVGLPGEKIVIEGNPITVPLDSYYVVGDNKEKSIDSRTWGPLKKDLILGRALFIYKPLRDFKILVI